MQLLRISAATIALFATAAVAGPKEDAEDFIGKFVTTFNAAKSADEMAGLFAPDAQFWGTVSPDLAVTSAPIRKYFESSFARRATAPSTAKVVESSVILAAPNVALASGRWQIDSATSAIHLRFSAVLVNRDGRWWISQFHSSPRPQMK
jgi:uncharacterized protein (TIGR02246 family)